MFSSQRLRDVLAVRLRKSNRQGEHKQTGYMYERRAPVSETNNEKSLDLATSMLKKVKVMRVFDLAGLIEAVGEVAGLCESAAQDIGNVTDYQMCRRTILVDSEDDIEEEEDQADNYDRVSHTSVEGHSPRQSRTNRGGTGMLVIDTISDVVGPVITTSQVQGMCS